jgi:glycosyltransferase involved in cell wall biosynthesis
MSETGAQKLKIILIASGCDGTDVGEAWNSFQWVSYLSKRHDVTLLTFRKRDKSHASLQLPGVRVIEWIDLPMVGRWERFNSMLKPGYVKFYAGARRWIKNRLRTGESFDLVHQISPVAMRYPSPAAGLGIPFILGPVGGSLESPDGFGTELKTAPWYTKLRLIDEWRLHHDPLLRHTYSSANLVIGIAPYVKSLLGGIPSHEVELMSEVGMPGLPPQHNGLKKTKDEFRLLFVGRVIRTKGLRDAIRAIAHVKDIGGLRFDVVGDGYDLPACREEARTLGVSHLVRFHGRLPRIDVDPFYEAADVFVFPSFREPGGIAIMEAMSYGLASIVADRGGPGFVVDDQCGIRIPVSEPQKFASQIAEAIRILAQDPALVAAMGKASREKVRLQYLWDGKIERMEGIYRRVIAGPPPLRQL